MGNIALQRWGRIVALLCSAYILGLFSVLLAYFAECGLPKLWDGQWHECVTAHWDVLPSILREHGAFAPLPLLFRLLEFGLGLVFVLAYLWLFVTTRWGRQIVFTIGILLAGGHWLIRTSRGAVGADDNLWTSLLVSLFVGLAAGAAYDALRTRTREEWRFPLAVSTWGMLGALVMLNQPISIGLLSLIADPASVLREMRLGRDVVQVALSVLFFAFICTVPQFLHVQVTFILGLMTLSAAFLPALFARTANSGTPQ